MINNSNIEKILSSRDFSIRINELKLFLNYYFLNQRPKNFLAYQEELIKCLPEIMKKMSFDELMEIIPNFYQFCYTISLDQFFEKNQNEIREKVLIPFSLKLKTSLKKLDLKPLYFETIKENYLIICRHALTKGSYAPGAVIYSMTDALLKSEKKVIILSLGSVDKTFQSLKSKNKNLEIFQKHKNATPTKQLINVIKICQNYKPTKIITEMPVNILTALYYSKISSKTLYWCPGFKNVPWYDHVLLVPELFDKKDYKNKKYTEIPRSINFELLNPKVELGDINKFKTNQGIEKNNFVMGTFARYEKISLKFLKLVYKILDDNKLRKIILAGPNDKTLALDVLEKFFKNGQAIILGQSDVHLIGNCCNIFLDTIPFPCGSSAVEMMAKKKPVLSLKQKNLSNYVKSRLPEYIFNLIISSS